MALYIPVEICELICDKLWKEEAGKCRLTKNELTKGLEPYNAGRTIRQTLRSLRLVSRSFSIAAEALYFRSITLYDDIYNPDSLQHIALYSLSQSGLGVHVQEVRFRGDVYDFPEMSIYSTGLSRVRQLMKQFVNMKGIALGSLSSDEICFWEQVIRPIVFPKLESIEITLCASSSHPAIWKPLLEQERYQNLRLSTQLYRIASRIPKLTTLCVDASDGRWDIDQHNHCIAGLNLWLETQLLNELSLNNIALSCLQLVDLITAHQATLEKLSLSRVLLQSGTWSEVLRAIQGCKKLHTLDLEHLQSYSDDNDLGYWKPIECSFGGIWSGTSDRDRDGLSEIMAKPYWCSHGQEVIDRSRRSDMSMIPRWSLPSQDLSEQYLFVSDSELLREQLGRTATARIGQDPGRSRKRLLWAHR